MHENMQCDTLLTYYSPKQTPYNQRFQLYELLLTTVKSAPCVASTLSGLQSQ